MFYLLEQGDVIFDAFAMYIKEENLKRGLRRPKNKYICLWAILINFVILSKAKEDYIALVS